MYWVRAPSARAAAGYGFVYGLGFFLFGVSWVYVSLHRFGAMPAALAAAATLLFCALLALFPAAAGYACARFKTAPALAATLLAPALWTLAEWVRGWLFTGFPWLALGYAQISESPLAGYAPLAGIYGVTLASALTAGLLAAAWQRWRAGEGCDHRGASRRARFALAHPSLLILVALWLGGWGLKQIEWTEPQGEPVTVSLLQGNVAQDLKWRRESAGATLDTYRRLAEASGSRLIVLPETALPLFLDRVPQDYLEALAAHARRNGGDILIGVPERLPSGEYYNSVVSFGTAPTQIYRKSHLVPFGEFIPLRPVLGSLVGALAIPLQDFSRGPPAQRPLAVAGQRVAVNISYEVAFGAEVIRQLPEATMLVNVTNVAWFGRSIASRQQLQIAQARALETGRYLVRATNTGVTAVINERGAILARAPEFTVATLTHAVQGYRGATPYVRWGNAPALLALALMVGTGVARSLRARWCAGARCSLR